MIELTATDIFKKRAAIIHKNYYSYDKSNYVKNIYKVTITCPQHGDYEQTPAAHLAGKGCVKCAIIRRVLKRSLTNEEFIDRSSKIHNHKYSYEKTNYKCSWEKVTITCPQHGDYEQIANNHIKGLGCKKCALASNGLGRRITTEEFIKKSIKTHGHTYIYSKSKCEMGTAKVIITCRIHGDYEQIAISHMKGNGCWLCRNQAIGNKLRSNTQKFITKCQKVHGDRYLYDRVDYKNVFTKVWIGCKKPDHGYFEVQPNNHLSGRGCPKCKAPKGELAIIGILKRNGVEFVHQYRIPEVSDVLTYDFYLPQQKLLIEFQGGQHFSFIPHFHETTQSFHRQQLRDCKKRDLAKAWGYKLLVVHHQVFDNSDEKAFEEYLLSRINQNL